MRSLATLPALLLLAAGVAIAQPSPKLVSPGGLDRFETISQTCPTFGWASPGNVELELFVYGLDDEAGVEADSDPVIHAVLPPGATNWTPPARLCLEDNHRYGWVLLEPTRAEDDADPEVRLFAVASESLTAELQETGTGAGASEGLPAQQVEARQAVQRAAGGVAAQELATPEVSLVTTQPPVPPPSPPEPLPADIVVENGIRYAERQLTSISVPGNAFLLGSENTNDTVQRSTAGFMWLSAVVGDGDVYVVAPIFLPANSHVYGMSCSVSDTSASYDVVLTAQLNWNHGGTRSTYYPVVVDLTGAPGYETWNVYTPGPVVEPYDYYWLEAHWQPGAAGDSLRFYGCTVIVGYWNFPY